MAQNVDSDTLRVTTDSLNVGKDTSIVTTDSLKLIKRPRSVVEFPIDYRCDDSMLISFDDKRVFLYGTANVKTTGMELSSEYMRMEMESNSIYAEGRFDSSKNELVGTPKFKDGKDEFEAKVIKYNFKTKEGLVTDVVTQQQSGYLFGELTKMHSNREIHLKNGRYTTCDLEHPHFYLELTRAKMIPDDKIISGPAYFVLLDVPVYVLGLPFGIFPQSRKHHSGIIIPSYGEESRRGFYLENGGYYISMGDYADLELLGSYYTYGSWGLTANSKFKVRYKFSGNFSFQFTKNVQGEKEFVKSTNSDIKYDASNSFMLKFNFNQDPKANPTSNFSANISYDKQNYERYNATSVQDYARSTTSSSVSYQKQLFGGFGNLSISANMTQNLYDSTLSFTAPTASLSLQRFFPFKRKVQIGSQRWYEKIGTQFNVNFTNSVPTMPDSLLFKKEMVDKMKYGLKYSIPLSTSFNILKYINVTPSINYTGRVYPNYLLRYTNNSYDLSGESNDKYSYSTDTIDALRHCFDFSTSISASTKLYGIFQFNNAKRIKAFRHVLTPSVGVSWRPDFSEEYFKFYGQDPMDTTGTKRYGYFQNGVYGQPPSGKSASLNFSLGNNFELKVKGKNDTIEGKYTKIKLLESLGFSGSYNMAADSMKLSNISMSGSTRLFDKMTLTFSGTFDPYQLDSAGRRTKYYLAKETGGKQIARLTSARMSTGFSLDSKTLGKKKKEEKEAAAAQYGEEESQAEVDEYGNIIATAEEVEEKRKTSKVSQKERDGEFDYYSCPWSLSVDYGFNYSHPNLKNPVITQTLNFSGSITFTEKWHFSVSSGYDFDAKKMTSTRVTASRDLHCFNLSFYIIPFGILKSYNFRLAINSSMFQGVEYKKTQNWRDN